MKDDSNKTSTIVYEYGNLSIVFVIPSGVLFLAALLFLSFTQRVIFAMLSPVQQCLPVGILAFSALIRNARQGVPIPS